MYQYWVPYTSTWFDNSYSCAASWQMHLAYTNIILLLSATVVTNKVGLIHWWSFVVWPAYRYWNNDFGYTTWRQGWCHIETSSAGTRNWPGEVNHLLVWRRHQSWRGKRPRAETRIRISRLAVDITIRETNTTTGRTWSRYLGILD